MTDKEKRTRIEIAKFRVASLKNEVIAYEATLRNINLVNFLSSLEKFLEYEKRTKISKSIKEIQNMIKKELKPIGCKVSFKSLPRISLLNCSRCSIIPKIKE
jgi:hypothetical protein